MATITAFLAAPGFEDDLAAELESHGHVVRAPHGRLLIVESADEISIEPAWAQDVWYECEEIEIASIGDAVRQLKTRAPRWALISQNLHRRAALIQEQLSKPRVIEQEFLGPLPSAQFGSWTLLEAGRLLLTHRSRSAFASGEVAWKENRQAPSRAYLKLWELFTVYGVRPKKGDRCLDLGASPGGWTWVLANLGCEVHAVDRSPLDPKIARLKTVSFARGNALALKPADTGPVDWLFSDVICYPQDLFTLVERWLDSPCRNFVCTLKFKGETDHKIARRFADIPGSRLQHLCANKHELTWWLTRSR